MYLKTDPRAFPAVPPPCCDDPVQVAEHDWAAFTSLPEMANHWNRPGWSPATRAYYWMLTFPDAADLIEMTRECQHALRHLEFDMVPTDGLHLTLARIGSSDTISFGQLDQLAGTVQGSTTAFNLQVIPISGSSGAIRFSIAPWTPLVRLHASLSAAGTKLGMAPHKPTSIFRPHVGIGYCNRRMSADIVRDAVQPLRTLAAVDVPVGQVDIVELRREERTYRWRPMGALNLH